MDETIKMSIQGDKRFQLRFQSAAIEHHPALGAGSDTSGTQGLPPIHGPAFFILSGKKPDVRKAVDHK